MPTRLVVGTPTTDRTHLSPKPPWIITNSLLSQSFTMDKPCEPMLMTVQQLVPCHMDTVVDKEFAI